MEQEELVKILKDNAHDGKLSCAAAFQISRKYKVSRKLVGEMANEAKIKIVNCQLGCFK